jgi:CubicO group peptidase (beta-lactamase class C family)
VAREDESATTTIAEAADRVTGAREADTYLPAPESGSGWRVCGGPEEVRELSGFDPAILETSFAAHERLHAGYTWAIAVVRNGWLVAERAHFIVAPTTRFDIWSSTKSFTATAWGLLLDEFDRGRPNPFGVALDAPIYDLIPQGWPLSDPRKSRITIRHILSMTSGIPGELAGLNGLVPSPANGVYEHALGHAPNRYGRSAATLVAEPGTHWEYSDAAFSHLSLAFATAAREEIADYLSRRALNPIGIENVAWDLQGGGGFIGPHTNAHTGLHLSARDFARFGYLALRDGLWEGSRVLPDGWTTTATAPSQDLNPAYGLGCWTNATSALQPGLPTDLFGFAGFSGNQCWIVPSLDLVVARVATGPPLLDTRHFLDSILRAIL